MTQHTAHDGTVDIHALIADGGVETHFQPITSIRRRKIVGLEALSRGVTGVSRDGQAQHISPLAMFKLAEAESVASDLDHLCRQTAMRTFSPLHAADRDLILFLNFHALALASQVCGPRGLMDCVERAGLAPQNIVIEVLESEFEDSDELHRAVAAYKEQGFLMALDDMGVGFSNLDRIAFIKPDILKLDRILVQDLHHDYHKQEIFKSLVNLSEKIGGWVVAEGIETQDEAIAALDLGADLMQGYYFSRPHKIENAQIQVAQERVEHTAQRFKQHMLERVHEKKARYEDRVAIVRDLLKSLQKVEPHYFDAALEEVVGRHAAVQSVAVLDENGVQISETVTNEKRRQKQKTVIFREPDKGSDHSLKEYYYLLLGANLDFYTTQPYVPLPSGDLCVTVSTMFQGAGGQCFVLCVHLEAEHLLAELATQNYQH